MSYFAMTHQLGSFLRLPYNYIITVIFLNCSTRVVLVYRTGILGYWSGNTPCWSGNFIYISRNDYTGRVPWSILPVSAIVSSAFVLNASETHVSPSLTLTLTSNPWRTISFIYCCPILPPVCRCCVGTASTNLG